MISLYSGEDQFYIMMRQDEEGGDGCEREIRMRNDSK